MQGICNLCGLNINGSQHRQTIQPNKGNVLNITTALIQCRVLILPVCDCMYWQPEILK